MTMMMCRIEVSHSIFKNKTEYPNYEGTIDSSDTFENHHMTNLISMIILMIE